MKAVTQVRLVSGNSERTCWIDTPKIRAGTLITLKDSEEPTRQWTVTVVGSRELSANINRGWHVGGL